MQMKSKLIWMMAILVCVGSVSLSAQSIAEKKMNLMASGTDLDEESDQFLFQTNKETQEIHAKIQRLYDEVFRLYQEDAPPEQYKHLLDEINERKQSLYRLEHSWREIASHGNRAEGYGLWHAPETTLEQLIIDYGSQDYVYLIPPEVGSIKLTIASNLPIPRASWNGMLELILTQNGIGVKTLNPYLRQLFLIKQSHCNLKLITNHRTDLEVLAANSRVTFVLSPEPSEVRRAYLFLEKFVNPNTTVLQILGRDILLVGQASDIQDLLRLYDFIAVNRGDKEFRLIPIYKIRAEEMANILAAMFDQDFGGPDGMSIDASDKGLTKGQAEANGLRVVIIDDASQALFVVGTREEVKKAEEIIASVESQIGGARDKTVHWYTVKHSNAEELADVLYRIYSLMIMTGAGGETEESPNGPSNMVTPLTATSPIQELSSPIEGGGPGGAYVVNPAPAQPGLFVQTNPNKGRDNFIVDLKTGSIVMVVEANVLPQLKELLRKLDVPKKMVQIETLLFERVLKQANSSGLNLLRLGYNSFNGCSSSSGSCSSSSGSSYSNGWGSCSNNFVGGRFNPPGNDYSFSPLDLNPCRAFSGIFEFFISHTRGGGIPAFDLAYRFLLSQSDIQMNSCPTILTVNQTPATITVNEDISLNTGAYDAGTSANGRAVLASSYTRAQYGTTISVNPTIHIRDEESYEDNGYDYVTLETDITFDTIQPDSPVDRPNVIRRHIKNEVQIVDGETVILGTLRRKVSADKRNGIPFIGEIPGIGKLFSETDASADGSEMFIFITPHIVKDPKDHLAAIRQELLCRRPGDLPYFLECLEEAHQCEKKRMLLGTVNMLLGEPEPETQYYYPGYSSYPIDGFMGEYDGR